MDGTLLVYKEKDWTSRDVCNKIQSIFHTKSVGHTGTLDPFAEGVLLVTINKANKIMPYVDDFHKTYRASLKLGIQTDTGDLTGNILKQEIVPLLNESLIKETLKSFIGKSYQIPPMTSAVHFQGRKLYELFYEGEVVERKPREIEIFDIKLVSFENNVIVFEAEVSKGTYLRVLGEDIAKKLNTVGHLFSLIRTKVGHLSIDNALKISQITEDTPLIPISKVLTRFSQIEVSDSLVKKIKDGQPIFFKNTNSDKILLTNPLCDALAIYQKTNKEHLYRCERGLW